MSSFTAAEIEYLKGHHLGRLATINKAGDPHVVPVAFRYNAELDTIDVGGFNMGNSKKFRDVTRDGRVAFVVDDALSPSKPRGVEIRGRAITIVSDDKHIGPGTGPELIRITPLHIAGWGIDSDDPLHPFSRKVK